VLTVNIHMEKEGLT